MFQPLYVAATGLSAIENEILNITNNLANAKTVAFKKGRTEMESLFFVNKTFKDYLYQAMSGAETPPINVEYGTGVRVAATPKDFTQGSIEVTSSPLDLAISGEGFFQFTMPDGTITYSRAGNLHLDNEGNLANTNGHLFEPSITVPDGTTAIVISTTGSVSVAVNNSTDYTEIGQITLARFANVNGLESIGQNLYKATDASGAPTLGLPNEDGMGQLNQYSLEQANVDVITEMMRMVTAQRVFDTVTKAVQSYEAMLASLDRMKS